MSFSTRCMTDADWPHVKHFTKDEFHHPDKMGYEFILCLDQVRETAGVPMVITSDARTHQQDIAIGGAEDSAHDDVPCNAVDIGMRPRPDDPHWNYSRDRIVRAAMQHGFVRMGIYPTSVHLDRTEDRRPAPRIWTAVDNPAH